MNANIASNYCIGYRPAVGISRRRGGVVYFRWRAFADVAIVGHPDPSAARHIAPRWSFTQGECAAWGVNAGVQRVQNPNRFDNAARTYRESKKKPLRGMMFICRMSCLWLRPIPYSNKRACGLKNVTSSPSWVSSNRRAIHIPRPSWQGVGAQEACCVARQSHSYEFRYAQTGPVG